ncbi:MAG: RNA methyltransferase [Aerococcus sp.]|nr:RNA methyltransferase [Aerococcus sp.]
MRKLQQRRQREKAQQYVIEGHHLVGEALKAGAPIQQIYATAEASQQGDYGEVTLISDGVADALRETTHSQGIFAVVAMPNPEFDIARLSQAVLLLDGIQDPGNLGTIVRTADAFGYQDILLGEGAVDPYNEKVLRAMQGSNFHVQLHAVDLETVIPELQAKHYRIGATLLDRSSQSIRHSDLAANGRWGLVLGNEGHGISEAIADLADVHLHIPMIGQAESLNVAIAGAVAMYQFPPTIES